MEQSRPVGPHTIASYDADLLALGAMINEMAALALGALNKAMSALLDGNDALAQEVIVADRAIDVLQHGVEDKAIGTIAKRQPVAVDLREIIATMRIANDLERIGDLAKNIAKRVLAIGRQPMVRAISASLSNLEARVRDQLSSVMEAYRERDDRKSLAVWSSDSAIDAMHTALFRELLTYMLEDPRHIGICAHLLFCAKNLERVGDHATNIAETVHYMITGDILASERPKADTSSALDPNFGT
jgi:phosphate transport system protein